MHYLLFTCLVRICFDPNVGEKGPEIAQTDQKNRPFFKIELLVFASFFRFLRPYGLRFFNKTYRGWVGGMAHVSDVSILKSNPRNQSQFLISQMSSNLETKFRQKKRFLKI